MKRFSLILTLLIGTFLPLLAQAAFVPVVTETTIFGGKLVKYGTYTSNGGSTGGDIVTNFNQIQACFLQPKGTAVIATQSVINETFPLSNSNGAVTIVTSADEVGQWWCFGY